MRKVYISAAFRSPIGKFGGALMCYSAAELAGLSLKKAIKKTQFSEADAVILGHARQAGCGPNPARQALILAELDQSIPAWTLNQACASGMSAVIDAAIRIQSSNAQQIWAGGVESMSNTPYLLKNFRWGKKLGHSQVHDGMYQDGFHCPMADMLMGNTVEEFIAQERKITREEQDDFALSSHDKALSAQKNQLFENEILEFEEISHDEIPREPEKLKKLRDLKPVFDPEYGTISAGNASALGDAASWLYLNESKEKALAEFIDFSMTALDPRYMGMGPVASIQKLLQKTNLKVSDIGLFEINEAFAAQAIACQKELKIPSEKLNLKGGAIALGHPIGATGARILSTLIHSLKNGHAQPLLSPC